MLRGLTPAVVEQREIGVVLPDAVMGAPGTWEFRAVLHVTLFRFVERTLTVPPIRFVVEPAA